LRTYVSYEPKGNWVAVAEHVPGRTAKQCRERWSLSLGPNIRKDPWVPEEDGLLLALHDQFGNAWAQIAKHLPGRTENATKSRFKSIERKKDRAWAPSEDATIIRGKAEEKKWSEISTMLPKNTRTKHAIKSRWKELVKVDSTLKRFDSCGTCSGEESLNNLLLSRPIPSESSPPNTQYDTSIYDTMSDEVLDEDASSAAKVLPHSLSNDKLMNLPVQRNESFEEWLAREAGNIGSFPMMLSNGGYTAEGGSNKTFGMFQNDNNIFASIPTFEWTQEDLKDIELV
jgi:hypothetical protein